MAFRFLNQELAMDLGTANTIIFQNDQIVLDEPSIVAIDNQTGKCIALGQKAKMMHEKTNPGIKTIRPLRDGVIADFNAAEMMIRGFIKQVNARHRSIFASNLPKGNMVVDIGGGTTEIAVISLGGIVQQESIRIAGDVFTADIQNYLRQQHVIKVGETTAEKIKIAVGAVIPQLDVEPDPFLVRGPNLMTGHPVEALIPYQEIAHCLDKSIARLEAAIQQTLEQTPPELYSDIVENGIFLSGGGSLLRGLDKRLSDKMNIPFHVAEDPLRAVARGTCIALKNTDNYSFLMR